MTCLPRERSRKMTKGSGGFKLKFATDGLFYLQPFSTIIGAELFDRFSGLIALCYDRGRNTGAHENRAAKRNIRINHDNPWFIRGTLAGEWIKPQSYALCVPIYPSKMCL